jgi:nicotinamidase-related amidase
MPEKNVDLHGSAPDKHKFALLLIDVINDFDFPEGDQLLKHARPMARILLRLKRRAQKAGVPVIYITTILDDGNPTFSVLSTTVHNMAAAAISSSYCGPKKTITSCLNQNIPVFFPRLLRLFSGTWKPKL